MGTSLLQILKAQPKSGLIELQIEGGRATLWLKHSSKRNAISASMMVNLSEAVDRLDSWQGSVLLIRGEGGHFSSGADLQLVQGPLSSQEAGLAMCEWMTALLNRIRTAPYLSVALIEGVAMGGGAELATAADFRLLSLEGRLQFVQAARGVSPGWGGAARLVEIVGRTRALRILATAQTIEPTDALKMGMADGLFEPGQAEGCLEAFVEPMLAHSPQAIRSCKMAIVSASREGLFSIGERDAFAACWGEDAQRTAMSKALQGDKT